jgi:hypothetical protein
MPPEILAGKVGSKGDILSLGLVFIELGHSIFWTETLEVYKNFNPKLTP